MKSIPILFLMTILVSGAVQASNNTYQVDVIKAENQRWQVKNVKAIKSGKDVVVSGKVNSFRTSGLPRGHIDVTAWSSDGEKMIAETTSHYSPRVLTRRIARRGGSSFTAHLPDLPGNALIKVAFHRDPPSQRQKPVHDNTVAR